MAGFRMHVGTAATLGVGYGFAAMRPLGFPADAAILAGGLTAIGGMLPDLDSDTGRPVREIFGLASCIVPLLLLPRLGAMNFTHESILVLLIGLFLFIRYGLQHAFAKMTVHRGMFHSLPAMLVAGLFVYLEYGSPDRTLRGLLATGVMLGFLSHLILDEIYSVDFNGVAVRLKPSAGSAVKLFSPSVLATVACYAVLGILASATWMDWKNGGEQVWQDYWAKLQQHATMAAKPSTSK